MDEHQELYTLLTEIYLLLDDGDRSFLDRFNLTPARYYALLHLGERAGISSSALSDLMLCDRSNISRLIKSMEAGDLVARRPHATDGRIYELRLTERGNRLRQQVITAHEQFNRDRFTGVTIEDNNLMNSLTSLRDGLQAHLNGNTRSGGGD